MTQSNLYTDDYMQASEALRLVLAFLSKHRVPASPVNYQVGYDYISGRSVALNAALDELLEQAESISEEDFQELHKKFIAQDGDALESTRQELQKIIGNIQREYESSNDNLSDYLQSLNGFVDSLDGGKDRDEIARETQKVMENTRSTEQSQRNFDAQMSGMMEEMQTLRQQLEQVREESLTDALTGLANRKAFDQKLDQMIDLNAQHESPFSLVIGDIDHFKKFNDTYGHLVGDKVLQYVAKKIKSCIKGKDMAARFGGEEFVLILPETDLAGAEIVAEQVRAEVSRSNLTDNAKNVDYGKITISLGVGEFQQNELSQELLKRADQALYLAKENGRNRIEKAA